jgi:hypothetical protein
MTLALRDVTSSVETIVRLNPNDIVVDIGANDGTLLRQYDRRDLTFVGFEPARNLVALAQDAGNIINDYFSAAAFLKSYPGQKAKIITAIAMFYDLENPNSFLRDIGEILDQDGLLVIQMNYLGTMLERNTFDNVSHEHLGYYSFRTLNSLVERNGLEIFDVGLNEVNGGSFRTYIRHKGAQVGNLSERVQHLVEQERKKGLDTRSVFHEFAHNVREIRKRLYDFIEGEAVKGKRIYIIGASTRGNTILQYVGLNNKLIVAAADRNLEKWGRKIVGTGIPIISREQARREKPDYFFILPYGFIDEIKTEERDYLDGNGKFIIPIPFPHVFDKNGELPI